MNKQKRKAQLTHVTILLEPTTRSIFPLRSSVGHGDEGFGRRAFYCLGNMLPVLYNLYRDPELQSDHVREGPRRKLQVGEYGRTIFSEILFRCLHVLVAFLHSL
jgi:hypothetical protein